MASAVENFAEWLSNKLKDLNTDENVFGSYITGILETEDTDEEKTDALQSILSEIITAESNITELCEEILQMYEKLKPIKPEKQPGNLDVDLNLSKLLESQAFTIPKQKQYTEEEKRLKNAILSQYSQISDDEEEDSDDNQVCPGGDTKETNLEKNVNAQAVAQAEKLKREQAKLESQKKKEKDKEDREKQKQLKEEKKEKRKTQKGERRR